VYQLYKIIVEVLFVKCGIFLELCTLVICIVILSLELCTPEIIGCVDFQNMICILEVDRSTICGVKVQI